MLKHMGKLCIVKSGHAGVRTLSTGSDLILPATDHRGWEADAAVSIKIQEKGPQSVAPISVPSLFRNTVESLPNKQCLVTRSGAGDQLEWTWSQYFQDVQTVTKVRLNKVGRFNSLFTYLGQSLLTLLVGEGRKGKM